MARTIDTTRIRPSHDVLKLLPAKTARAIGALPLALEDGTLVVCLADKTDFNAIERVEALLPDRKVEFVEAQDPSDFRRVLRENYPDAAMTGDLDRPENLFVHVMRRALARNASDIHISPTETETLVRLRIDGRLQTDLSVSSQTAGKTRTPEAGMLPPLLSVNSSSSDLTFVPDGMRVPSMPEIVTVPLAAAGGIRVNPASSTFSSRSVPAAVDTNARSATVSISASTSASLNGTMGSRGQNSSCWTMCSSMPTG